MKNLIILLIYLASSFGVFAQIKPAKVGQKSQKPLSASSVTNTVDSKPAQVTLSSNDLAKALNGGSISNVLSAHAAEDANKMAKTMTEIVEKQQKDYIYGNGETKSYQIRYSSAPVKAVYDEFVPPLVANFTYAFANHNFIDLLVSRLGQAAIINGAYTSPGAQRQLEKAIRAVFIKVNITTAAAIQPNSGNLKNTFYPPFLNQIFESTQSALNHDVTWTTTYGHNGDWPTTNTTSSSEFSISASFMSGKAVDICVETARMITKNLLPGGNLDKLLTDNFSKALLKANNGDLFKPIRSFKAQSSEFEVFTIQQNSFQKSMQQNGMKLYWDNNWNCPSSYTFSFLGAIKVKNASVYNP